MELSSIGAVVAAVLAIAGTSYLVAYNSFLLAMVGVAARELARRRSRRLPLPAFGDAPFPVFPGISIIVPAYNEQDSIVRTVRNLLALAYPRLEVIVVSDGSTDRTLSVLEDAFELWPSNEQPEPLIPTQNVRSVLASRPEPRLRVVDKRNGGKADALNSGINLASHSLVCIIDADVLLDREALLHMALPFQEDPRTVATSGTIRLLNGCEVEGTRVVRAGLPKPLLERFQVLEYLRAMGPGRLFFNPLNAHLLISGAFGIFRRDVLIELEGYHPNAIGEDMELVVRIQSRLREQRRDFRIVFVPEAICYTEAPFRLAELGKQRTRWQQGLLTSLLLHRGIAFNRGYGSVGLVAAPYFLLFELFSPFVETLGWLAIPLAWAFGWLSVGHLLAFLGASALLGSAVSLSALLLDALFVGSVPGFRARLTLAGCAMLEHFGYHQILLYYRLRAFAHYYGKLHLKGGWVSPSRLVRRRDRTVV